MPSRPSAGRSRPPTRRSWAAYPRRPLPGADAAVSPRRWAAVAASTRERTPSLARMRETWTLAVFSEMKSDAPISRFVWPSGDQGQDRELARGQPEAVDLGVGVRHRLLPAERDASASREPLDLRQEQRGAQGRGDV